VGKYEVKGLLDRPRRRWVDNIKIYFNEIGCVATAFVWLRPEPVWSSCGHGNEHLVSVTDGEFVDHFGDHQLP
jgi:hypothetical protein